MTTELNTAGGTGSRDGGRAGLQIIAGCYGALFLVVGIAAFLPGLTTHGDMLVLAHRAIHLLMGVVGMMASRRVESSRVYLLGAGAVYGVLWFCIPVPQPDRWLHLGVAVVMIAAGALWDRCARSVSAGVRRRPEPAGVADRRTQNSRRICAMTWPNYLG